MQPIGSRGPAIAPARAWWPVLCARAVVPIAVLLVGCGAERNDPGDGRRVAIYVSPLRLDDVDDASFTITVTTPTDTVWTKTGLLSSQFGDGHGSLAYVGPCDASAGTNTVTLTIDWISAAGRHLLANEWRNPGALSRDIVCRPNADSEVRFDLTLMRSANQGFFDVAVEFDDLFCSAKVDCQPELLFDAGGERALTAVFAFACTAGPNQATTLYMDDLRVECDGGLVYPLDPAPALAGNQSPVAGSATQSPPGLFQTAVYWGKEALPNLDKCYWNTAVGLDLATLGHNCHLRGEATAAATQWLDRTSPADAAYPKVAVDATLTGPTGALACVANPLDVQGSGVQTTYTHLKGEPFFDEYVCGAHPTKPIVACTGGGAQSLVLTPTADNGVTVGVGSAPGTAYHLPAGVHPVECCVDPCCEEGDR